VSERSEMLREQRVSLYRQQAGKCFSCAMPMRFDEFELAHRIPERGWCMKHFGRKVVDHEMNKAGTHRGACNSKAQLDPNSLAAEDLAENIRREIRREEDRR
jgi:hypothetical protein